MKMKVVRSFFDEDIVINEKLFDNFQLKNIVSWSHLELWCAIQNVEVNSDFFKGILCGTPVITKLYEIVLDEIQNSEFLDKYIDDIEVIEILEKLFCNMYVSRTFKGKEFWINMAYKQNYVGDYMNYFSSGIASDNEKKYKLFDAIFKKKPLVFIKFYDKFKLALHHKDIDFERWLLKSFSKICRKSEMYSKVFVALNSEIQKQIKLAMYLN